MLSTNSKSLLTENTFHAKFTQSKIYLIYFYYIILSICFILMKWNWIGLSDNLFLCQHQSEWLNIGVKTNLQNLLYDLYFHFLVNWNQQSKNRLFPLAMTLRRGLSIYKQRRSTAAWPHPRRNFRKTSKAIDTSIGLFRSVYITFF
jgi:hypothetical protein